MPVKIRGNTYYTVAERIAAVHKDHPENASVFTEVVSHRLRQDDIPGEIVVKATVTIGDMQYTDHAHEIENLHNPKAVNHTSYVENCCTSAIGRALAAAGRAGDEYPSADEMTNALGKEDGNLLGQLHQLRRELAEARETEAVLMKQLGDTKKLPIAITAAEEKITEISETLDSEGARLEQLKTTCFQLAGEATKDFIALVNPGGSKWTRTQALLLLCMSYLKHQNGGKSDE